MQKTVQGSSGSAEEQATMLSQVWWVWWPIWGIVVYSQCGLITVLDVGVPVSLEVLFGVS